MSIEVMNWAWKLKLSSTQKIVLVALADRANDDWECWPGQQSLAEKCSLSERGVRKALIELEELGYLRVEHRNRGSQKTNLYRLVEHPEPPERGAGGSGVPPERGAGDHRHVVPVVYKEEPSVEPSVCAPSKCSATKKPVDENPISFDSTVGEFRDISASRFEQWESLFKKIDVIAEIEKAEAWLKANPRKRKKNYDRFLLNWFARAEDRAAKGAVRLPTAQGARR